MSTNTLDKHITIRPKETVHKPTTAKKSSPQGVLSDRWIFTWNNPTEDIPRWENVLFCHYQKEKAPSTGTIHYQGFVLLKKRQHLSFVRKLLPKANWRAMRGTPQENLNYTSKDASKVEGPWHFGISIEEALKMTPGRRTDIEDCLECIEKEGHVAAGYKFPSLMVRCGRGLMDVATSRIKPHIREDPTNLIWFGPPNTGKSYKAQHDYPDHYLMPRCNGNNLWWGGYDRQKCVIIDEFGKGAYPITTMNILLDKVCPVVDQKGKQIPTFYDTVIIISNDHPDTWYRGEGISEDVRNAFFSRFYPPMMFTNERKDSWRSTKKKEIVQWNGNACIDSRGYKVADEISGLNKNISQVDQNISQVDDIFDLDHDVN